MAAELVGPLRRVWFNDGMTAPRYYNLPKSTLDPRYEACADHHPACDCREASIAEAHSEQRAEIDAMYNAILDAIKGHQTYAWTADGERDEFATCKCPACDIARKAHVGYWRCRNQRQAATEEINRERWKRRHRATLSPRYPHDDPYDDIEVPF